MKKNMKDDISNYTHTYLYNYIYTHTVISFPFHTTTMNRGLAELNVLFTL